jgi:hypothetical protein
MWTVQFDCNTYAVLQWAYVLYSKGIKLHHRSVTLKLVASRCDLHSQEITKGYFLYIELCTQKTSLNCQMEDRHNSTKL